MGPLDLLRGFAPGIAQQLPRNPWIDSANLPPFWPFDPAAYDGSDVAGPMLMPDRSAGSSSPGPMLMPARPYAGDPPEPMPMIDRPDLSIDDIRPLLLAGAAAQIRPGDFALNPDNWPPTLPGRGAPWQPITPTGLPAIIGADSAAFPLDGSAQPQLGLDA